MHTWTQAVVWLSVGLYGHLIVHHTLQAFLSKERTPNLYLIAFLVCSLAFSFVDVQMYQSAPQPPSNASLYARAQFVLSALCAVLFVQILDRLLQLGLRRWVRVLWLLLLPLLFGTLLGWIVTPEFKAHPTVLGGYYIQGVSTGLGVCYSAFYLLAYLGALTTAYLRWQRHSPQDRLMLGALGLTIPLIVVDMLVYYGVFSFLPTWNWGYGIISLVFSLRLNAQIYQLASSLRRANRELQDAYRQMVEQERLSTVGQIVQGIVHDLKNFFNNVQSLCDVGVLRLRKDPQFDAVRHLESIRGATQQAYEYLMELLSMTREGGDSELTEVAPAQIVREVERLSGARLLNPPVQIENRIPSNLRMYADRRALMQLFLNLTLNAIQAMRDWNGERRIEYEWVEHPEKTILVIRDTGPGMPPEVRDHLFERAITTKQGGSGIGLMLVQRAIEQHNGSIQVHSECGKGTMFVCVFPTPPLYEPMPDRTLISVA
ncbi:MAG: HAMP domain-containing histidine kinase [Fimbriimonadales bacterium]|nr:HAMP domain-containing histidine kinase [Fimbriimonadales bacterium]